MVAILSFTGFVHHFGYLAVFLLSVLHSCCVPTSSEITLGYAGLLASQGTLSLPAVILVGAGGELVGAYVAYLAARIGGRALVDRYGRFVLLSHKDIERAESWFSRHERLGVLVSRLVPVVRNFVAVPAGLAEVPPVHFGVLTAIGSLIWDGSMALIGYGLGSSYEKVMKGFGDAGYVIAAVAVVLIAVGIAHRWRAYRSATAAVSFEDSTS
jgi:membrane protein DedA with SNARE-associated domain